MYKLAGRVIANVAATVIASQAVVGEEAEASITGATIATF